MMIEIDKKVTAGLIKITAPIAAILPSYHTAILPSYHPGGIFHLPRSSHHLDGSQIIRSNMHKNVISLTEFYKNVISSIIGWKL